MQPRRCGNRLEGRGCNRLAGRVHARRPFMCMAVLALALLTALAGSSTGDAVQAPAAGIGTQAQNFAAASAGSPTEVAISGLVRQPLHVGLRDLGAFGSLSIRRVDHRTAGFFGDFDCRGVPLASLLSLASPQKESSAFMRPTDLAIAVRNAVGQRALFSYGELFFHSPDDVLLAFSADVIMPKKSCNSCHGDKSNSAWREALNRKPVLPRLVASRDFDADRSLEGVTHIEVVELLPAKPLPDNKAESEPARSQSIEISDGGNLLATVYNLNAYPRRNVRAVEVGDSKGYHGEVRCEGALLADVLATSKTPAGPDIGYLITAIDGYRALLSSGEVFSTPQPPPILLADRCNGQPLGGQGAFKLIVAGDTIAERWIKSVSKIETVRVSRAAHLYVIGVGPADTSWITLEAISRLAEADCVIAPEDIAMRFGKYLAGKQVLFDPVSLQKPVQYLGSKTASAAAVERQRVEGLAARAAAAKQVKDLLAEGKTIALLDYGDPSIFGTWRFLQDFGISLQDIELVAGTSSFNIASAALRRDLCGKGTLVITTPPGIANNDALVAALAEKGETVAVMVGLFDIDTVQKGLEKHYQKNTPVAIVYKAGYHNEERVVFTVLGKLRDTVAAESERHLGIIFVGSAIK